MEIGVVEERGECKDGGEYELSMRERGVGERECMRAG